MRPILGLKKDPYTGAVPDYLGGYQSAIDYLSSNNTNATVTVFNRMYVRPDFPVKPNFSDVLSRVYHSDVREISTAHEAATDINSAVSNATRGRIENLVSADQLQAVELVLVSALYFKALWQHPFKPDGKRDFLTAQGERQVQMMSLRNKQLLYADLTAYEALALPYTDPDFCLLLLLPPQRSMPSVRAFRDSLGTVDVSDVMSWLEVTDMHVSMPKFTIEAEYNLPDTLSALGIQEIFTPGSADFSELTDVPGLYVSDVIHKVFMEVTEEGTEAAGAGAVLFARTMPKRFIVDRPFVAVVYNTRHNLNLFSAYVASPSFEKAPSYDTPSPQHHDHPVQPNVSPYSFRTPPLKPLSSLRERIQNVIARPGRFDYKSARQTHMH